ncbi:MAG: hypothetical protein IKW39_01900, partial [Alphaproteobacteria bacterium]|nr:hypothetical protein [Alphaproteobacteria bacterium]
KEYGKYLTKTNKPLPEHINTKKSSKKASPKQSMCIRLIPEFRETSNTVSEGKCKILTLHPSIKKDDVQ